MSTNLTLNMVTDTNVDVDAERWGEPDNRVTRPSMRYGPDLSHSPDDSRSTARHGLRAALGDNNGIN